MFNNDVERLLNNKQYDQRSDDWYKNRYNILTASNIASVLDANPYLSKLDLLIQKCQPFELVQIIDNPATQWGIKYEPIAIKIYENIRLEKVFPVGLFIHDNLKWLGASPDGLRESGKLVEIKCVWKRKLTEDIPLYYWMQVQIQLEVCNLEECDLFQCKFIEYKNKTEYKNDKLAFKKGIFDYQGKTYYWKLDKYSLNTIYRDKKWFNKVSSTLYKYWKDIIHYRKVGYEKLKIQSYSDNTIDKKRKRTIEISQTILKKQKYIQEDWSQWINASDIKNYIMKDPLLDWLNIYGQNQTHKYQKDNNDDFNRYIISKELEFQDAVIQNLYKRFPKDIVSIAHRNEKFSVNKHQITVNAMIKGIPIILNGILHNRSNNTYGMPDIILRKDYLNNIIKDYDNEIDNNKSHIDYKYCIINIKYISLTLKNGLIVNTGNIMSHKSELIVCNNALMSILGYVPDKIYMIGRKYKSKNITGPFENIGMIDIMSYDYDIVCKTYESIAWLKDLKENGENWDIYRPHRNELYPNMSNMFDYPWHNLKKQIAKNIGEITLLWNCGIKERNMAHMNNIYRWEDLNSDLLSFKNKKKNIIDNIIRVNTSDKIIIKDDAKKIKKEKLEFFVDFETVNSLDIDFNDIINYNKLYTHNLSNHGIIYMIGIGWEHPVTKQWQFASYTVNRLNAKCEKEILLEWIKYMIEVKRQFNINKNVKVYHWSKAEVIESKKAFKRHNIKDISINWNDLLDYFKDNYITIKGVYNFGLKAVANSLYKHKMIKTRWADTSLDGTSAMLAAWNCEKKCLNHINKKLIEFKEINEIIKYNEIDCKVMWDILKLFK